MKAPARNGKKKYGPNIVRAWFDTVFQYILGRMESESKHLSRRNWTYRFYNRTLEFIAPLGDHMPMSVRENLDLFVTFFPEVSDVLEAHDRKVVNLTDACAALHDAIVRDSKFQEVFDGIEREAPEALGVEFCGNFGALSSRADFAAVFAEYLVDNFGELPSYYATSRLWNRFRDRFVPVMTSPEIESLRLVTEKAGQELLGVVENITSMLKTTRFELSVEFDVPPAIGKTSALSWHGDF